MPVISWNVGSIDSSSSFRTVVRAVEMILQMFTLSGENLLNSHIGTTMHIPQENLLFTLESDPPFEVGMRPFDESFFELIRKKNRLVSM